MLADTWPSSTPFELHPKRLMSSMPSNNCAFGNPNRQSSLMRHAVVSVGAGPSAKSCRFFSRSPMTNDHGNLNAGRKRQKMKLAWV